MAIGAGRASLRRMIVAGGLRLALPGVVLGGVAALSVGYALRSLLIGLGPVDPLTLGGVTTVLLGVVAVASLVPGRRAASVQPVRALRTD